MGLLQRLATNLLPRKWAQALEDESRTWVMQCPKCGQETSIWQMGGIRFKAAGRPWRWGRCAGCQHTFMGQLYRRAPQTAEPL
jgi:hypothetical protein